jgi:hypothetical protein
MGLNLNRDIAEKEVELAFPNPPHKLLKGEILRRLFTEAAVPPGEMQSELEVASWGKLYAARVRGALA